jgi:hypothetical protein
MSHKPNFVYYKNPECTFYSGYYIKFNDNHNLLLKQLNLDRMEKIVAMSIRDFRNGWKTYNKKIIETFELELEQIQLPL